ncbi:SCP2 sterol-binding domain-containing protein [Dictyobacter formicarum]|uniref:Sterol-binding protein n=1 Tax=Dictyobacter formicarum TaxID=2778368 RepID=A0ABQ3VIT3_9CHLR|nr:SCP2 sterol-binding domain-containing protein [Dictyobacter formicarum]GHO86112.1 sterol-binding protein [Dictyobacter formicarum]
MKVVDTFAAMQKLFNPAAAAGLNKTIQLNITGEDAGVYALKIENQACELVPPESIKPDLTLTMSDQDWIAITQGQLNPMNAFLSGKIKATGDMMLAMKIPNLFSTK